jgi:hypothetical protein
MSGYWPSDGDDADDVFPGEDDLGAAETDPRLAEVAAYLASVPPPVLPDSVEARISAAITAEAATRAAAAAPAAQTDPARTDPGQTDQAQTDQARTLKPGHRRPRIRRPHGRRRYSLVAGPLVAILLFVGLGYFISQSSSSSSSSALAGAAAGSSSASASAPGAEIPGPAVTAAGSKAAGGAPVETEPNAASPSAPRFAVTQSGTQFRQATLAAQVRAVLAADGSSQAGTAPSPQLLGCVLHFTASPRLVDQSVYQGTAAYVIASASRVWVVGLGCSAAKPELVVSVPLAG